MRQRLVVSAALAIVLSAAGGLWYRDRVPRKPDAALPASFVPVLEKGLTDWIQAYRAHVPRFTIRTFRRSRGGRVALDRDEPYDPAGRWERVRRPIYVFSPDGDRFIDPFAALQLQEEEGRLAAAFVGEQAVALVDLRAHRSVRLLLCEGVCGFHGAVWLSSTAFAVVGHREDPAHLNCPQSLCAHRAAIWIYEPDRRTAVEYIGPQRVVTPARTTSGASYCGNCPVSTGRPAVERRSADF